MKVLALAHEAYCVFEGCEFILKRHGESENNIAFFSLNQKNALSLHKTGCTQ